MKNPTKILIGVVVVALIGAGVYFGNTKLQKGSLVSAEKTATCNNTWTKIFEEKVAGDGTSDIVMLLKEGRLLDMIKNGCSFKASRQGGLALVREKGFSLKSFECKTVSYLYTPFKENSFIGSFSCSSGEKEDGMGVLPSIDLYFTNGKVSSFHPSVSKNDMYEYTFNLFAKK